MVAIPVEWCVGGRELTEPRLSPDGTLIAWVESAQGVTRLLLQSTGGGDTEVLADTPALRAGRGLGGGCWCWSASGDAVVYAAADGNLWSKARGEHSPRQLTDLEPRVAQAPAASANGRFVVFVLDQMEVWRLSLQDLSLARVDDGSADFCFDPAISADSASVVWQAWNVPDMPWDAGRMERVLLADGERDQVVTEGSLQQPQLLSGGRVICVRDDRGWANVWLDDRPLVDERFEHGGPTWGLGQRSFAISPDGRRVAFTRNERGFGRLCVVDVASGAVEEVARGVHGQLSWKGDHLAALRTGARTRTQVVVHDTINGYSRRTVDSGPDEAWDGVELVEPELLAVTADDGANIHARLFRADNDSGRLICWLHGGPTDQWQVTFMPRIAFWRSRGWNVLVPDHRGSTGHGREYQQALRGRWGELDVADTLAFLRAAHQSGVATPDCTVLFGGSSGGFTVLGVLGAGDDPLVAAAVVSYPVTDLADLAERSHRFERHYTRTLVEPEKEAERSPVNFAGRIHTPLLVFHGDDDPVVPIAESRILVERMRASGADVELVVYPGEGHGFRLADNQIDEYRRIDTFVNRHIPVRD